MKIIREDSTSSDLPSAEEYAAVLYGIVTAAVWNESPRFDGIRNFSELHDRCDANEFYQLVDEAFGLQVDEYPQCYFDIANEATERVNIMFGWVVVEEEVKEQKADVLFAWNEAATMLTTIHSALCESLATLVTCRWCAGVWIAAGVMVARTAMPRAWQPVSQALALSAAAVLLSRLEDG